MSFSMPSANALIIRKNYANRDHSTNYTLYLKFFKYMFYTFVGGQDLSFCVGFKALFTNNNASEAAQFFHPLSY